MIPGFSIGWNGGRTVVSRRDQVCSLSARKEEDHVAVGDCDGGGRVVLGLNQYSHDASVALVDSATGELLFAAAKERISRRKHDGGETSELVRHAMYTAGVEEDDIGLIVRNNHHFRIAPFERRLPFAVETGVYPVEYLQDPFRTDLTRRRGQQPQVRKVEISHHLAHAWSVLLHSPFPEGLIVVMDGMGEHVREFLRSSSSDRDNDDQTTFHADCRLPVHDGFREFPVAMDPGFGYREAESAFLFRGSDLTRVFKRWTRENSPPELYNHGFENMESLGALYSRVSSHIFGDWNACGKVMGLAPWASVYTLADAESSSSSSSSSSPCAIPPLLSGSLLDGSAHVHLDRLAALPLVNRWDASCASTTAFYAQLADRVQTDVETEVLRFVRGLRERTGARNLSLVGGVALNSTINGVVAREGGFDNIFVPPCPGDEGIALGCASFGADYLRKQQQRAESPPSPPRQMLSPYLGRQYSDEEVLMALEDPDHAEFVVVDEEEDFDKVVDAAIAALVEGKVVAWYQGRSEFGPRALGNRSLLADPRRKDMVDFINIEVKKRETFRPFAPSVLDERANEYFELGGVANASPYMSITAVVKPDAREKIPAVAHIDGTARLQTVREQDNPRFHRLIARFAAVTGIPVLLNTSFNVAGQPIVETPSDAVSTFLSAPLGLLVVHNCIVQRRQTLTALEDEWTVVPVMEKVVRWKCVDEVSVYEGNSSLQITVFLEDRDVDLDTTLQLDIFKELFRASEKEEAITVQEIRRAFESESDLFRDIDASILGLMERRLLVVNRT